MKKTFPIVVIYLIVLTLILACAPKTTPTPAPSPPKPATPIPAASPASTTPQPVSQDAEWAKVVEAAKKEGKVTLYTFFFTARAQAIVKGFEQKYPEIKLEFVPMASAVRLERLKTEQRMRQYIADTSDGSSSFQMNLKKEGFLMPVGNLPSLKDAAWSTSPQLDPEGYLVNIYSSHYTLWSNTTQVKSADEPRSLKDLLDAKWKGKIIQVEPATSSVAPQIYAGYTKYGKADDNYFRQLGPQQKFITGSALDLGRSLARGEAPLGWGSPTNNALILDGAPIKPLELQEGALITPGNTQSIINNAPHPNAAKVFFNWLISKEGQQSVAENQGLKSMRKDVPDSSPAIARMNWKNPIVLTLADVDYADEVFSSRKLVDMWGRK